MINKFYLFFLMITLSVTISATPQVQWSYKLIGKETKNPSVEITAVVPPGYHLYAPESPPGGGISLSIYVEGKGFKNVGKPVANKSYIKEYNDIFELDEYFYTDTVKFTQKIKPTEANYHVQVEVSGQIYNENECMAVRHSSQLSGIAFVASESNEEVKYYPTDEAEQIEATVESVNNYATNIGKTLPTASTTDNNVTKSTATLPTSSNLPNKNAKFTPKAQDGKWGLVAQDGKWILKPKYDKISPFGKGAYIIESGDLKGIVDTSGKISIKPELNTITPANDSVYFITNQNKKVGIVTALGEIKIKPKDYDQITNFLQFWKISKDGLIGLVSKSDFSVIAKPIYSKIGEPIKEISDYLQGETGKYIIPVKTDKWGVLYDDGTLALDCKSYEDYEVFLEVGVIILKRNIDGESVKLAWNGRNVCFYNSHYLYSNTRNKQRLKDKKQRLAENWIKANNFYAPNSNTHVLSKSELKKVCTGFKFFKEEKSGGASSNFATICRGGNTSMIPGNIEFEDRGGENYAIYRDAYSVVDNCIVILGYQQHDFCFNGAYMKNASFDYHHEGMFTFFHGACKCRLGKHSTDECVYFFGQDYPRGRYGVKKNSYGIYLQHENGKYYLYSNKKLSAPFDDFEGISAKKDGKWGQIDINGWYTPCVFDAPLERDKVLNEYWGYINGKKYVTRDGKVFPKLNVEKYDTCEPIECTVDENYLLASLNGKYGIISIDGTIIIPFEYDSITASTWPSGYKVQKNGKVGCYDIYGDLTVPVEYDAIDDKSFAADCIYTYKNGKIGVVSKDAEIILPPLYSKSQIKAGPYYFELSDNGLIRHYNNLGLLNNDSKNYYDNINKPKSAPSTKYIVLIVENPLFPLKLTLDKKTGKGILTQYSSDNTDSTATVTWRKGTCKQNGVAWQSDYIAVTREGTNAPIYFCGGYMYVSFSNMLSRNSMVMYERWEE